MHCFECSHKMLVLLVCDSMLCVHRSSFHLHDLLIKLQHIWLLLFLSNSCTGLCLTSELLGWKSGLDQTAEAGRHPLWCCSTWGPLVKHQHHSLAGPSAHGPMAVFVFLLVFITHAFFWWKCLCKGRSALAGSELRADGVIVGSNSQAL